MNKNRITLISGLLLVLLIFSFAFSGCSNGVKQAVAETTAESTVASEDLSETETAASETTSPDACGSKEGNSFEILCFGDSNTYGYDPTTGGRYPDEVLWTTLLEEKLGDPYTVINEGLNGRTTAYDVPGVEGKNGLTAFQSYLTEHRTADVVIFMLGSNDLMIEGLSAEDISSGMEQLLLELKELSAVACGWNPKIVVVAPPKLDADLFEQIYGYRPEAQAEISAQLAPLYEGLAEKYHCLFLDASEILEVSALDGVHLTEQGHQTLAERLYELLAPVLEGEK